MSDWDEEREALKADEPEVWLLACQLQMNLAMTFTWAVDVARNILTDVAYGSAGFTFARKPSVEAIAQRIADHTFTKAETQRMMEEDGPL